MTSDSYYHPAEEELLELLLSQKSQLQNQPQRILDAIDIFAKKRGIINVGPQKGAFLLEQIRLFSPEVIFELGTHTGYSSILMAQQLEKMRSASAKVHTFSIDPGFTKISSQIIALAGLSHRIVQHFGKAGDIIEGVAQHLNIEKVDLVLFGHSKDQSISDLRILETLGLVTKGTTLCTDSITAPGVPDYLEYVHSPPVWRRDYNSKHKNPSGRKYVGNWGLTYESVLRKVITGGGDSDGVEITKCTGTLD